jgi:hypothetical protein
MTVLSDLRTVVVEAEDKVSFTLELEKIIREREITSENLVQASYSYHIEDNAITSVAKNYSCLLVYKSGPILDSQ